MSMEEGSISSHIDNDSEPESKELADAALTPEDIAWVDSCLIKEVEVPDISDGNWNHTKDELLEILDLYPQSFEFSLAVTDEVPGSDDDVDMLLFNDVNEPSFPLRDSDDLMNETGIASEDPQNNNGDDSSLLSLSFSRDGIDFDLLLSNNVKDPTLLSRDSNGPMNETEIASKDQQNHDVVDTSLSFSSNSNPFLPTYKEEEETIQTRSSNDLFETESEPEAPMNVIFKVWDLNLPAPVEDELVEQLNKALSENSANSPVPSTKDSNEYLQLADLINSISELSLEVDHLEPLVSF